MAYVISPEGETGIIADSDVENAVKNFGFKLREPSARELQLERANTGMGMVETAMEGAARSIPLIGEKSVELADWIAKGISPEKSREQQALRQEANPISAAAGSAAGYAIGLGKVTRGLRAGGALVRAAAGAVEGGVVGLNEGVNEAIIKDKPLTAEQLAASTLSGALAGGIATAGAEAVARLGAAAAPKVVSGARAASATIEAAAEKVPAIFKSNIAQIGLAHVGGAPAIAVLGAAKGAARGIKALGSEAAEGYAQAIANMVERRLAAGADFLGPFRPAIEQAYSQGPEHLLQTHENLMNSPRSEEYQAVMGIAPESPEVTQATAQRLNIISGVKAAADAQAAQVTSAVDGLFRAGPGRKPSVGSTISKKEFEAKMGNIDSILRDPEALYMGISPEVAAAAPEVMGTAVATMVRAAQYMKDHAPQSPYANLPASVAPQWEPSAADLDKFNRVREAVEEPAKVLRNMAQGLISPDQVEAMKAVYPAMYEDLRLKISERLMQASKPLTYQQRLGVMAIVGPQALGMSAQQAQILQQSFAPSQPQQQGGMKGPDGRQTVNQEKNLETQSQRLERR